MQALCVLACAAACNIFRMAMRRFYCCCCGRSICCVIDRRKYQVFHKCKCCPLAESVRHKYAPLRFRSIATSSIAPTPRFSTCAKNSSKSLKAVPLPHSPRRVMYAVLWLCRTCGGTIFMRAATRRRYHCRARFDLAAAFHCCPCPNA